MQTASQPEYFDMSEAASPVAYEETERAFKLYCMMKWNNVTRQVNRDFVSLFNNVMLNERLSGK